MLTSAILASVKLALSIDTPAVVAINMSDTLAWTQREVEIDTLWRRFCTCAHYIYRVVIRRGRMERCQWLGRLGLASERLGFEELCFKLFQHGMLLFDKVRNVFFLFVGSVVHGSMIYGSLLRGSMFQGSVVRSSVV